MTFVLQRRSKKDDNMSHDTGRSQYTRFIFFTRFSAPFWTIRFLACAQSVLVKTRRVIDEIHDTYTRACTVHNDSRQRRLAERI